MATLERIKIKTVGFADDDVSVTPGMRTVTSENSIGRTKYADMLDIRNQNANPIMRNPAMTLTSAKTLIPLLVRVRILSSAPLYVGVFVYKTIWF